ncbi:MAG TPA: response regulator [Candidatus Paenibacillus intestinavium]|nr:response regulator [Candidatus Paenibacillus intestinavium]
MLKTKSKYIFILLIIVLFTTNALPVEAQEYQGDTLILRESTEKVDLYSYLYMLEDNEKRLTIDDVASVSYADKFTYSEQMPQKGGFFEAALWTRFEVHNQTDQEQWLFEIAFPLVYFINIYSADESGIIELHRAGTIYPFEQREINHRNFIFNLKIEANETKTFYILLHGAGGLHPPFYLWNTQAMIQKSQTEFTLLGIFYGMVLVMILYNLFLYFSLRLRSYLYYVLAITCTVIGQLSLNGLGFQYLWPYSPWWNTISTPFWVSLACIGILMFARSFLDTDRYFPKFKSASYILTILNALVIVMLFISNLVALNIMLLSTVSTFITVLTVAFICLRRGARQARFFIVGWPFFFIGISVTILERAAIIPFSNFTEYAGQITLVVEVVLLSLALADKINIMRSEKELAEHEATESHALVIESLKQADELKDEFLAITSHELRTPLYGMIGIAESIRDGATGDVPAEMSNQLAMIITSGNRLSYLINDILDFSKLKHHALDVHKKPIHLPGLVDIILTICQPLVKHKAIKLINLTDDTFPAVNADQDRLQQILYNLVGNAIKYTDHGEVVISAELKDEQMKISVSDTGKGISKEQQDIIFEPFQQGDVSLSRDVGGTGIGLNITKQLVELHGGIIEVHSKVGFGSIFSFTLPIQPGNEYAEEIAITIEPLLIEEVKLLTTSYQPQGNKLAKILVADDEPINLQVLMNQLTLEGYQVLTASNGEEVLSIIEGHEIELVILDIMMPKMSGYEVCQLLRKNYSLMELPILMLTAKNQVRDRITAFEVGANDYLLKPCDKQELLSRVKTLVRLRSLNQKLITLNLELEEKVQERTQALEVANIDLTQMNEDLIAMADSRRHLLANIAHELGTPITLIHSYVQALQAGLVGSDDAYFSNLVHDKMNILSRLISDLSDLSKLEAGQSNLNLQNINLDTWLGQIYRKFELEVTQYGRFIELTNIINDSKHFSCFIDIGRMDQVFSNLISNAVKNTPEGTGKVSIQVEVNKIDKEIIIQVKDNGYGIREDKLPFIFDRFYKASASTAAVEQTGTGLGLAIVKEIVHAHEGRVWVGSDCNEGCIFYVALPVRGG